MWLKSYSPRTIKAHISCVKVLYSRFKFIALSYGAGLRVNEVTNLKVEDIDLDELTIHIKQAKGAKDRITIFPEKLKNDIKSLTANKGSSQFFFESIRGGKLTPRTAQKV